MQASNEAEPITAEGEQIGDFIAERLTWSTLGGQPYLSRIIKSLRISCDTMRVTQSHSVFGLVVN